MAVKYCPLCDRKVEPTKRFNWPIFILLLVFGGVGAIIYFIYYLLKPKNRCPICGTKKLMNVDKAADMAAMQKEEADEPVQAP